MRKLEDLWTTWLLNPCYQRHRPPLRCNTKSLTRLTHAEKKISLCYRGEKMSFISFSLLVVLAGCLSPFLRFSTSSQNTPSTSRNKLFAHAWVRWIVWRPNQRQEFSLSIACSLTDWPIKMFRKGQRVLANKRKKKSVKNEIGSLPL